VSQVKQVHPLRFFHQLYLLTRAAAKFAMLITQLLAFLKPHFTTITKLKTQESSQGYTSGLINYFSAEARP
jgi:Ca2+/H+ antiporter